MKRTIIKPNKGFNAPDTGRNSWGRTCFNCQHKYPIEQIDKVAGKNICIFCYPYVDERAVAGMITFDQKQGNPA